MNGHGRMDRLLLVRLQSGGQWEDDALHLRGFDHGWVEVATLNTG